MEIEKLSFARYLDKREKSFKYVEEYLSENEKILKVLEKYDDLCYLDDFSKFFFLYKESENLLIHNYQLIKKNNKHLFSICVVFASEYVDFERFIYGVRSKEDVILYIYIFFRIEIVYLLNKLILENKLYKYFDDRANDEPLLLNNPNLLIISPFIFNLSTLNRILNNEIALILGNNPDYNTDEYLGEDLYKSIYLPLKNLPSNIKRRIGNDEFRIYDLMYLKSVSEDYKDLHEIIIGNVINSDFLLDIAEEPKYYTLIDAFFYTFDTTKLVDKLNFNLDFSKKNRKVSRSQKEKIELYEQVKKLDIFWEFNKIEVFIDLELFNNYIDGFINSTITDKDRRINIKIELKELVKLFYTVQKTALPKIATLSSKELQDLMRLFKHMKNRKLINYSRQSLAKILLDITESSLKANTLIQADKTQDKLTQKQLQWINDRLPILK